MSSGRGTGGDRRDGIRATRPGFLGACRAGLATWLVFGTVFGLVAGIAPAHATEPAAVAAPAGAASAPGEAGSMQADAGVAPPGRCDSWTATRRPLFGDLHVHSSLSFDANSLGVRNMPSDAYRFARGKKLGLQPYDDRGVGLRQAQLERPLDFAAVTDHAELLGELQICQTPGMPGHESFVCNVQRRWPLLAYLFVSMRMLNQEKPERYSFCGKDGSLCRQAAAGPWETIQDAAEEAYDRTNACTFTTFVAYEWSGGPGGNMTHRNVIFADERAPELPISYLDEPRGHRLWKRLEKECRKPGCRFLTIPHNTNLSNGKLFNRETASAEDARRRRLFEPLVEVIQHKGDSECRPNAADEFCSFEKLPFSRMEEQPFDFRWEKPARLSFVREILGEGLLRESALGVNPFHLGLLSSTDSHLGTPGLVEERDYPGHGAGGDTSRTEMPTLPDSLHFNPGGLAGVWAEENSRESIWAAMQRREVFSTSGPRIVVRFFGGFDYPDGMCSSESLVEDGYALGVSMGGELAGNAATGEKDVEAEPAASETVGDAPTAADANRRPVFVVAALQDAGTSGNPGTPLDRLQIVKIWLDQGELHEKVFDVATTPADTPEQALNPKTCAPSTGGSASLCAQWRDDDWQPHTSAVYYARVLEKPSCRWTGFLCAQTKVDCRRNDDDLPEELEFCCKSKIPKTTVERAITSPIWISAHDGATTPGASDDPATPKARQPARPPTP